MTLCLFLNYAYIGTGIRRNLKSHDLHWENKTKLVVRTVRISKLAKPNGDCMTEKLNTSWQSLVTGHSSAIAEHVTSSPGGKTPHMKGVGMLVGIFELNP